MGRFTRDSSFIRGSRSTNQSTLPMQLLPASGALMLFSRFMLPLAFVVAVCWADLPPASTRMSRLQRSFEASDTAEMPRIEHSSQLPSKSRRSDSATASTCDLRGGVQGNGKCFFVPDNTATWSDAEAICNTYGGHLASVASAAENNIVYSLYVSSGARESHGAIWIGMGDHFQETGEGQWRWSDGTTVGYTIWDASQPDNWNGGQDCAVMWKDGRQWDDQECDDTKRFVCAVQTNPVCDALGGIMKDDKCFFVPDIAGTWFDAVFVPDNTATWSDAEAICNTYGGHLASVASAAENDIVYSLYVSSGARESHSAIWIGMGDHYTGEGQWRWSDGSAVGYTNWDASQPDNWNGGQDCAVMWKDGRQWDDQECDDTKRFVCAVQTNPVCDKLGGVWRKDKCFFMPSMTATWAAAEAVCSEAISGGHLASIASAAENAIVYGMYVRKGARDRGSMWIGMSDVDAEGSWEWSDGSAVSFRAWRQGQPDNWNGQEDCATMWLDDRSWNDDICSATKQFLCSVSTAATKENYVAKFGWVACAQESESCNCHGVARYSAKGYDVQLYKEVDGEFECTDAFFGVASIEGDEKECHCSVSVESVQRDLTPDEYARWKDLSNWNGITCNDYTPGSNDNCQCSATASDDLVVDIDGILTHKTRPVARWEEVPHLFYGPTETGLIHETRPAHQWIPIAVSTQDQISRDPTRFDDVAWKLDSLLFPFCLNNYDVQDSIWVSGNPYFTFLEAPAGDDYDNYPTWPLTHTLFIGGHDTQAYGVYRLDTEEDGQRATVIRWEGGLYDLSGPDETDAGDIYPRGRAYIIWETTFFENNTIRVAAGIDVRRRDMTQAEGIYDPDQFMTGITAGPRGSSLGRWIVQGDNDAPNPPPHVPMHAVLYSDLCQAHADPPSPTATIMQGSNLPTAHCSGHGACSVAAPARQTCECEEGWSGADCQLDVAA